MSFTLLERIFLYFFPESLLEGTPWKDLWDQDRQKRFVFNARIIFPIIALVYVFHYYFVDIPEGIAPSELWFNYRFSMAGLAMLCLGFYATPSLYSRRLYKVPTMIAFAIFCYFQARTIIWYDKVPYVYALVFVLVGVQILQFNVSKSVVFASAILALQWSTFLEANISPAMAMSANIVTLIFIVFVRSNLYLEIMNFISQHERIDVQQKMIQTNLEFTDRIKAFLPKEISRRLTDLMARSRLSVLQATDEVLRQKKRHIAGLFSDIRGFTQGSKQLEYVGQKVIPNVKECIDIIENFTGIPRKIGDLIFAYFDSPSRDENVLNALTSGFEMIEATRKLNLTLPEGNKVVRYVLLSSGEAIVGNLGGFDSSIEITALGSPVNLLSRVDEITKAPVFREKIDPTNIIITAEFAETLQKLVPTLDMQKINLEKFGLRIRDFENIDSIFAIPSHQKNRDLFFKFVSEINEYTGATAA